MGVKDRIIISWLDQVVFPIKVLWNVSLVNDCSNVHRLGQKNFFIDCIVLRFWYQVGILINLRLFFQYKFNLH